MKKIMFTLLFSFPMLVQAEELKFITVLSSPVGTFNRVEEVDTQTPVTSPVINFCTHLGNGSIRLNGNANPTVAEMTLSNGTTLGGNVSEYRLQSLTMNDRGTLNGSRLLANTVNANTIPTLVRSSNIYANTLTVQGAKTKGLNVGDGKSVMSELGKYKGKDKPEMVWSNEYQNDDLCKTTGCAKQYLLKSKGITQITSKPEKNIICTEDSRGGCGSAFDSNGNPSYYWIGTPLCDAINGWDENFEGECVYIKNCTLRDVTGTLVITGAQAEQCQNSARYNQCGSHNVMLGNDWYSFREPSNADQTCRSFCTSSSVREGYCAIEGTQSMAGTCIVYSQENGCSKYTLTCKVTNAQKQEAVRRTCKRA